MAENGDGFEGDHHLAVTDGTSFSQLLFAADEVVVGLGVDDLDHQAFNFSSSSSDQKSPKMLCFGNYHQNQSKKSGVTCSDSSTSVSSTINNTINSLPKSNNTKRNGLAQESLQCSSTITKSTMATQRSCKRTKTESPTSTGNAKRKEKLGERITALQQLVSPFGKTDTASVLHEAMGYIRFLHDQVQVLCSPYLQCLPSLPDGDGEEEEEQRKGLRSRGLCLVPVEYTMHVANNNGADFWSPAMANNNNNNNNSSSNNVSSATTKY